MKKLLRIASKAVSPRAGRCGYKRRNFKVATTVFSTMGEQVGGCGGSTACRQTQLASGIAPRQRRARAPEAGKYRKLIFLLDAASRGGYNPASSLKELASYRRRFCDLGTTRSRLVRLGFDIYLRRKLVAKTAL
ncbi:MAG TPA: hypothetical protein VLZ30_00015 [Verrucomicrobiae bacterium]|nr:hypothetical protein [Verrucomicrobiae bacterium]